MSKNPVLQMSKARRQAWLDHAKPDDFFEMLTLLSRLYAKKNYTPDTNYNSGKLLADYPEYLKRKSSKKKYTNNVPFASEGDAPGSYVEETPMDEINKLIDEL
jgi:hypothetical protein